MMSTIIAGTETQVNQYTTNFQELQEITALEGGGWVTTWMSSSQDGSRAGVYQRIYAADGTPLSDEIRVNTTTAENQNDQKVTALDGGGWVVTWVSDDQDGSNSGIYQQAYAPDGTPAGIETRVNFETANEQSQQQVTALDGGGWVVAWRSLNTEMTSFNIYFQAYASDGTPEGLQTQVNTPFMSNYKGDATITALDGGGWVVTWMTEDQDGSERGIFQQAYAADGTLVGSETQVNTYVTDAQYAQVVAPLDGGGWVVAWQSIDQDGYDSGIYQQVYAADGMPQGEETRVNTYTEHQQAVPVIAVLEGGGWVVTWRSAIQDGGSDGIYQQVFAADGTPQGVETRVNTIADGDQTRQDIAALSDGGWVVVWQSVVQDGSAYGIFQQAYFADGTPQGDETLVNSYTTGNQLYPQVTALDDGGWVVTWTSINQDGSQSGTYQKVFHLNDEPVGAIADQIAAEDHAFSFTIPADAFTDDEGDPLTFSATLASGDPLPAWLVFDPTTRTFSGTPTAGEIGEIEITVTVGDGVNPHVSDTFVLTVDKVNGAPEGTDNTVTMKEDKSHTFAVADFGFDDSDGDAFSTVVITTLPSSGTLKLDGEKVVAGQSIDVADLDGLIWKPARDAHGDALAMLTFQVIDDGGDAHDGIDTDQSPNTITFDVTGVAERIVGDNDGGTLRGTGDDDIMRGKRGEDILLGKAGDDNLRSVGGDDILKGGKGADTFVFSTGSRHDTIADFQTGIDEIDLSKWKAIDDFGDVRDHAKNHGDDVWITAGKDVLVIADTHRSDLDAGDFSF